MTSTIYKDSAVTILAGILLLGSVAVLLNVYAPATDVDHSTQNVEEDYGVDIFV